MASSSFPNMFVPGPLWNDGPAPGQFYHFPGGANASDQSVAQRTLYPSVTGTSVIGIKFKDGVILAADMLGSYGSLARFRNCSRLLKVTDETVLGSSGDYADFQFLTSIIRQKIIEEECLADGFLTSAPSLHSWLTRVLYNRRSQLNPLWNSYVVAGYKEENLFLGYVNMLGVAFEDDAIATGFGAHLALPILRDAMEKNKKMDEKQAVELIDRCMKILYYRDARSLNKYQIAVVTKKGAEVRGPIVSQPNWQTAHMVKGYE